MSYGEAVFLGFVLILQTVFPGLWLTEVTVDTYKVSECPDNGKVTDGSLLDLLLGKCGIRKKAQLGVEMLPG